MTLTTVTDEEEEDKNKNKNKNKQKMGDKRNHTNSIWHSSILFEMWFVICVLVAVWKLQHFWYCLKREPLQKLLYVQADAKTTWSFTSSGSFIVEQFVAVLVHIVDSDTWSHFGWNAVPWVIGKQESRIAQKFNDANKRNVLNEKKNIEHEHTHTEREKEKKKI